MILHFIYDTHKNTLRLNLQKVMLALEGCLLLRAACHHNMLMPLAQTHQKFICQHEKCKV